MSRRLMLRNESGSDGGIPIGVELVDKTKYYSNAFYHKNNYVLNAIYTDALYTYGTYQSTYPIPYSTEYTFDITGFTASPTIAQLILDEDQKMIGYSSGSNATATSIKNAAIQAESNTGKTAKYIVLSNNISVNDISVMRTG